MVTFCDVCNTEDADKHEFSINEEAREIDLCDEHWEEFLEGFGVFMRLSAVVGKVAVDPRGRRTPRPVMQSTPESGTRHTREETAELRIWAELHKVRKIRETGKIAACIWEAFRKDDLTLLTKDYAPEGGEGGGSPVESPVEQEALMLEPASA